MSTCIGAFCQGRPVHVVGQEFGTYRDVRVLSALRAENRWHHYGDGWVGHWMLPFT